MKPFISLCMIVKNEEKVIERCLSSISNFVDEIIVVDTGSTDRTKEISSKFTNNIYHFDWINDFSAARNFAASKANGDWILVLDADEYVDEENIKIFIQELKEDKGAYDMYSAKILNFTGNFGENLVQNFHDRIYKNNGNITYYRKIHEQFKNNNGKPLNIKISSLLIFHSGYLNQTVKERNKNERNKQLLDQELENENKNAFDYFNLGNEYCSIGEYKKALESYLEAYALKSDFRLSWVSTTLVQIIICLINLKRYNEALQVTKDAQNIYRNSPELPYLKGEVFFLRGQMEDSKEMFLEIINNNEKYNHILFRPDLKDQRPHIRLGEIYLYQEDYTNAIYHYTSVLNINKHNEVAIKKVIYILNKFHSVNEITAFLNENCLIDENNIDKYVKACFTIGNPSLAISLLTPFYEENKLIYGVAKFKKICVSNEGEISELGNLLQIDVMKKLIESNWLNIVDLYLLKEIETNGINLSSLFTLITQNTTYQSLIKLMSGETPSNNLEEELFLFTLQMGINYKKYSIIDTLLEHIEAWDKKLISKVAALLYSNGYKVEGIQLYDMADWNTFTEQDFINILNSLVETDNKINAIEISKYAIMTHKNDFRFYEFILKNTDDHQLFKNTMEDAKGLFHDSIYLEKIGWSRFF